jgi:Pyridoxamine 5'-phosphate oxidase
VLTDGQIAFWTYRKSQKALNLERDPRISCLVEDGGEYFDLRGVLVQGIAHRIEDSAAIADIGRGIAGVVGGPLAEAGEDAREAYVAHAASKRFAYLVEPRRVISWDHTKLSSA